MNHFLEYDLGDTTQAFTIHTGSRNLGLKVWKYWDKVANSTKISKEGERAIIKEVKEKVPGVKVYIWSGYTYEELQHSTHPQVRGALELADVLIDGPYIEEERDITLAMRGSRNQRIIDSSETK